jgi:hypothetical protein
MGVACAVNMMTSGSEVKSMPSWLRNSMRSAANKIMEKVPIRTDTWVFSQAILGRPAPEDRDIRREKKGESHVSSERPYNFTMHM